MALQKFARSTENRRVAGLFGGLGEAFGVDPAYLRLAFILFGLITGVVPALIGYAIGWAITPEAASAGGGPGDGGSGPREDSADPDTRR